MKNLIKIGSKEDEAIFASRKWLTSEKGISYCESCGRVNRTQFPVPYDIELSIVPMHRISGVVLWTGLKIYHKEFIDQIRDYLGDFTIGKCVLDDGSVLEDFMTLYSRRYILIRGNKKSKYRTCQECGTVMPIGWYGRQYALRSYLTSSRVYQNPFNGLCIDEELALQIDFSPWPDADLQTIEIRDEPMDEQDPPYRAEP